VTLTVCSHAGISRPTKESSVLCSEQHNSGNSQDEGETFEIAVQTNENDYPTIITTVHQYVNPEREQTLIESFDFDGKLCSFKIETKGKIF
jgi:hypothetical protein